MMKVAVDSVSLFTVHVLLRPLAEAVGLMKVAVDFYDAVQKTMAEFSVRIGRLGMEQSQEPWVPMRGLAAQVAACLQASALVAGAWHPWLGSACPCLA